MGHNAGEKPWCSAEEYDPRHTGAPHRPIEELLCPHDGSDPATCQREHRFDPIPDNVVKGKFTMSNYLTEFVKGLFGRKGLTERAEEANLQAVRDEFLTPTTALAPVSDERLRAMDLDALRKLYRRAIDSGDSDLASRITQRFRLAEQDAEREGKGK
jgi:hypothetical protein